MQNEKWGNIISDILEKIQENVNGKIDIVREMPSHSFVPVYRISLDDEKLDITLPMEFIDEIYYFGNTPYMNTKELAYAVLYEIEKAKPDKIKPEYRKS